MYKYIVEVWAQLPLWKINVNYSKKKLAACDWLKIMFVLSTYLQLVYGSDSLF